MPNRFVLPLETPVDATGSPYPGGKLFFYAAGTSTKLNTYSDSSLQIANTNPVVLDSAGRFPNAIFLQNLAYKVILAPATDSDPPSAPIWTQDPVYASDYSTYAQFKSVNGSPNGQLAGTAGSSTILASAAWDYANNILYVCTTSGTASTAVWTAVNAATAAAVVPSPQGYLTLTSGTPIITGDVAAATAVYYTPYTGLLVPIYNGTSFVPSSIVSQLQLTLNSSHVASNIYDFFIFSLSGVVTLGTGPSWSAGTGGSIAAGSCARGTGAGGTALTRLQGVNVNAASMTVRYGDGTTTTTVAANQGTYVGSMFMDDTNGQVSCYLSYGQNRKWGIWNAYNKNPVTMQAGDSTTSWSYTLGTVRASNGSSSNKLTTFSGLPQPVTCSFKQMVSMLTSDSGTGESTIGIGFNVTSAFSGLVGDVYLSLGAIGGGVTNRYNATAEYIGAPVLGINNIQCLESTPNTGSPTFYGTATNMLLSSTYLA